MERRKREEGYIEGRRERKISERNGRKLVMGERGEAMEGNVRE